MTTRRRFTAAFTLVVGALLAATPVASAQSPTPVWTVVPSPRFGGFSSGLNGVSCTSPTSCIAVGFFPVHFRSFTVAEQWDGKAWTLMPTPDSDSFFSGLNGVSCSAAANCTAVGGSLIEHWDGTAWSIVAHPGPSASQSGGFSAVSCPAPIDCTAVGTTSGGTTFIEQWDGTAWTTVRSPNPTGASHSQLLGVSCTTAVDCTAVGTSDGASIIERWDGTTWTIVPHPDLPGATSSAFNAVSCSTGTDCFAVGSYHLAATKERELIERWDGTRWRIVPGPQHSDTDTSGHLFGVSCTAPTTCTAVGTLFGSTLIEQWNGTEWTMVASPAVGSAVLAAVSCITPADCTTVGSNGQPLIEHSETANAAAIPLTVTVRGSQAFESSDPLFATATTAPAGDFLVGTLTCTTVGNPPGTISPTLPVGTYTLNGSNCSGLSLSGTTAANYLITYADGTFTVNPRPAVTTTRPETATTTSPSLAFTGGPTDIAPTLAVGLITMALGLIQLRRRSDG